MRPEIQQYFRDVAEKYEVVEHIRFHSVVEKAVWIEEDQVWRVTILNQTTKERTLKRSRILVSAVGSLSVPKRCETPGVENFKGSVFHSAEWDHSFNWKGKDVVVLGKPVGSSKGPMSG